MSADLTALNFLRKIMEECYVSHPSSRTDLLIIDGTIEVTEDENLWLDEFYAEPTTEDVGKPGEGLETLNSP